MKDQALAIALAVEDPQQRLNRLREYLQAMVLRSLHDSEAFRSLAFVGGTALRFLHQLPRFSEDLDFSLVAGGDYRGADWMARVKRDLELAGFDTQVAWNDRKVVHTAWIRVAGVLRDAGLSAMRDEKLAVKLEIDTRPPAGARCERDVVTKFVQMALQHYDLPSLLAGKLHAVLTRKYPKGRDWYDLLWYRSAVPPVQPNLALLQNALDQTQGAGTCRAEAWETLASTRMEALDFEAIGADVRPFLERPQDAMLLTREVFERLLARR